MDEKCFKFDQDLRNAWNKLFRGENNKAGGKVGYGAPKITGINSHESKVDQAVNEVVDFISGVYEKAAGLKVARALTLVLTVSILSACAPWMSAQRTTIETPLPTWASTASEVTKSTEVAQTADIKFQVLWEGDQLEEIIQTRDWCGKLRPGTTISDTIAWKVKEDGGASFSALFCTVSDAGGSNKIFLGYLDKDKNFTTVNGSVKKIETKDNSTGKDNIVFAVSDFFGSAPDETKELASLFPKLDDSGVMYEKLVIKDPNGKDVEISSDYVGQNKSTMRQGFDEWVLSLGVTEVQAAALETTPVPQLTATPKAPMPEVKLGLPESYDQVETIKESDLSAYLEQLRNLQADVKSTQKFHISSLNLVDNNAIPVVFSSTKDTPFEISSWVKVEKEDGSMIDLFSIPCDQGVFMFWFNSESAISTISPKARYKSGITYVNTPADIFKEIKSGKVGVMELFVNVVSFEDNSIEKYTSLEKMESFRQNWINPASQTFYVKTPLSDEYNQIVLELTRVGDIDEKSGSVAMQH
jgi:hypothetical protein